MTQSPDDARDDAADDRAVDGAAHRRRMDEVFGDVLPETTSDERDPDDAREESSRDTWFRDQVPPHHG